MLKKTPLILLSLLLLSSSAFADRNSRKYRDCSEKYTPKILEGNSMAFKRHIIECQGKPDSDVMYTYSNNSYKDFDSRTLVCMGDIYNSRSKNASFSSYKLAAEMGNTSAMVSLGIMAQDKEYAKKMPISKEHKQEYLTLTKTDKDFNFLRIMNKSKSLKTKEEKIAFQKENTPLMREYANLCKKVVKIDLNKTNLTIQEMTKQMRTTDNRDIQAWIYTEGRFLNAKKDRLTSVLRKFGRFK